jgi:hypothetical protein
VAHFRQHYRVWDAQQSSQKPVSPCEALPEDALVFFLLDLIPQLDLSTFHQHYAREMRGQPPFDVTMMVTLLVYAYADELPAELKRRADRLAKIMRVATDLLDAQSSKDLAPRPRRRGKLRGPVRAEGCAEAERPQPSDIGVGARARANSRTNS